jgi:cell division septal protein FtsQ
MRKQKLRLKLNLPFKLIASTFAVFCVLALVSWSLLQLVKKLDYFRLEEVIVTKGGVIDLSYLKGHNIFDIDLERESRYISSLYPNYKNIRLVRVLPNRLFVEFISRKPVACIKLYRAFCVDQDMVLFDWVPQAQTQELPLIVGLETKIFGPKAGIKYHAKELAFALQIIQELKRNKVLKYCKLARLDVTNPADASLSLVMPQAVSVFRKGKPMQEALEIKMGQGEVRENIAVLAGLLMQLRSDWQNLKYIDLRFKEPVIKLREKETGK